MLQYVGLRDLALALREVKREAYDAIADGLEDVGEAVREEAREIFPRSRNIRLRDRAAARASAAGFETRVRPGAEALVVVGQRLRKTTGLHPEWGELQVRYGLWPAREHRLEEAGSILEERIGATLRANGF